MSFEESLLSGLDILDGLSSRRVGTILFAIEGRTAQFVSRSRLALASYLTEKTVIEKEQAFFSAIAQGRDLPVQPTIQNLERFAPEWASLVPSNENQRAALTKLISEKYHFQRQYVPALRKALGLDTDEVKEAYARLFQKPIDSIYTSSIPVSEQIRWLTSRLVNSLERMPPFWTAFSLTLTETVGGSVLALPIALAGVGPIPGITLLFIFGLVNILTIIGIVEAITRNGNMRYGTAYFGRLVSDYLGKPGNFILVPILLVFNVLALMAYYVGISTSLTDVTGISPMVWSVLIFLIAIYFLRGKTLNATVAFALVIGIINILILIILSVLVFPYIQSVNLQHINLPFGNGQMFNPKIFELVFGVVLAAYFGHTSAGIAAKEVLRRDPGGKSLIWGNIAAMMTAIALYSLWVFAVNGAIPSIDLSNLTGTALSPLASKIGGGATILGVIYVILAMGIGSVHNSYSLFYQVREVLPSNINRTIQFLVSLVPLFALFLLIEWMFFTHRESFPWIIGILGVILVPILGGIFPLLMLVASRRKGDYVPKFSFGFLGNPFLLTLVYLVYLGSVFIYGFLIWEDPFQRLLAISIGIMVLIVTYLIVHHGAFTPRVVIELKVEVSDVNERASLAIVNKGKPMEGIFKFVYANGEQSICGTDIEIPSYKQLKNISIEISPLSSKEIKVWLHRVTPEGNSEPIPVRMRLKNGSTDTNLQLDTKTCYVIRSLILHVVVLEITLL